LGRREVRRCRRKKGSVEYVRKEKGNVTVRKKLFFFLLLTIFSSTKLILVEKKKTSSCRT